MSAQKESKEIEQAEEIAQKQEVEELKESSELNQEEEAAQIGVEVVDIVVARNMESSAYKVFNKMSMLFDEVIEFSDAVPKESEMLIDNTMGPETSLFSWDGLKVELKIDEVAGSSIDEDKLDRREGDLCFDPGRDLWVASYGLPRGCDMLSSGNLNQGNEDRKHESIQPPAVSEIKLQEGLPRKTKVVIKDELGLLVSSCDDHNESKFFMVSSLKMSRQLFLGMLERHTSRGYGRALCFDPGGKLVTLEFDMMHPFRMTGALRRDDTSLISEASKGNVEDSRIQSSDMDYNAQRAKGDIGKLAEQVWLIDFAPNEEEECAQLGHKKELISIKKWRIVDLFKLQPVFDPGIVGKGIEVDIATLGKSSNDSVMLLFPICGLGDVEVVTNNGDKLVKLLCFDPGGGELILKSLLILLCQSLVDGAFDMGLLSSDCAKGIMFDHGIRYRGSWPLRYDFFSPENVIELPVDQATLLTSKSESDQVLSILDPGRNSLMLTVVDPVIYLMELSSHHGFVSPLLVASTRELTSTEAKSPSHVRANGSELDVLKQFNLFGFISTGSKSCSEVPLLIILDGRKEWKFLHMQPSVLKTYLFQAMSSSNNGSLLMPIGGDISLYLLRTSLGNLGDSGSLKLVNIGELTAAIEANDSTQFAYEPGWGETLLLSRTYLKSKITLMLLLSDTPEEMRKESTDFDVRICAIKTTSFVFDPGGQ